MSAPERLRLFIAFELPEAWRTHLAAQSGTLEARAPGFARWVDPSLMHLTLVFLGNQPATQLPRIQQAMDTAAAGSSPITLHLAELGSFGSPRALRVIWRGVTDHPKGALDQTHARLSAALAKEGIVYDSAPFRPHLTLGRARRDASSAASEAMAHALRAPAPASSGETETHECSELVLIRSDLRPSGPVYTPLYRSLFC